jgi:aldose 1-epimerase
MNDEGWSKSMAASLSSQTFGHLRTGETIEVWTLVGAGSLVVEIITYGGIVLRLLAPDRDGCLADVVLGFNDLDSYLADRPAGYPYFGAIIGRVAGRITGGVFDLEGKTYELARNDPPNHLHGGIRGFDKRIWIATPKVSGEAVSLQLTNCSPDGEEGYPGTVNISVTYTVTSENVLLIATEAITDVSTPFNLTHHSYFNLGGEASGSIGEHELQINADEFVATDQQMTLLGRLESVADHGNDLRRSRPVRDVIPLLFQNHGDLYLMRRTATDILESRPVPAARLVHPGSGRVLNVSTTEKYLQLYTGSGLDGSITGKSGVLYGRHSGICLECEGYPDGANAPGLGDTILHPGNKQCQTTAYAFTTTVTERAPIRRG